MAAAVALVFAVVEPLKNPFLDSFTGIYAVIF